MSFSNTYEIHKAELELSANHVHCVPFFPSISFPELVKGYGENAQNPVGEGRKEERVPDTL